MYTLDVGTKMNSISSRSETFAKGLVPLQKKNRKLLFRLITREGFVNAPTEWWHYSYGDQYWAAFYGKKQEIFGVK